MSAPDLNDLVAALREGNGVAHKRDIAAVVGALGIGGDSAIAVGDDCAAIAQPGAAGHLLLAIEGFIPHFVEADPWFAGWCGVMVNVSDVYAMGGRPTAIVNALWGRGDDRTGRLLDGMRAAARCYQVPMVGGHSNLRCEEDQLAVAILGHATRLLTSFDARPGDRLLVALDLRGAYRPPFAHWNCTTDVDPARLRADLDLLPMLAEAGLCRSAKDISQAGVLGTLMMLMECSGVGARIAVAFEQGAAMAAGLSAGDIIIAVDGLQATAANIDNLLANFLPGENVEVHAFRRDELMKFNVTVAPSEPSTAYLTIAKGGLTEKGKAWLHWKGNE